MNLGNLAFTDEEIFKAMQRSRELVIPGEVDSNAALGLVLNRILGEKLAKSPKAYGRESNHCAALHFCLYYDTENATHTARLILIEEMK